MGSRGNAPDENERTQWAEAGDDFMLMSKNTQFRVHSAVTDRQFTVLHLSL